MNGDRDQVVLLAVGVGRRIASSNLIPHADEIKLRGSIGISGNQPLYGLRDNVLVPNGSDRRPQRDRRADDDRQREHQAGEDARSRKSASTDRSSTARIGLETSYYNRTITDMLLTAPLAPSSGFGSRYINGGVMKTAGVGARAERPADPQPQLHVDVACAVLHVPVAHRQPADRRRRLRQSRTAASARSTAAVTSLVASARR